MQIYEIGYVNGTLRTQIVYNFRNPAVAVKLDTGEIYSSKCTCQHDLGERCSHVGAVLYMLEEISFCE